MRKTTAKKRSEPPKTGQIDSQESNLDPEPKSKPARKRQKKFSQEESESRYFFDFVWTYHFLSLIVTGLVQLFKERRPLGLEDWSEIADQLNDIYHMDREGKNCRTHWNNILKHTKPTGTCPLAAAKIWRL